MNNDDYLRRIGVEEGRVSQKKKKGRRAPL